ncbi:MAG: hypothetical protein U5R48_15005 [Gammaproteobacteria bacterium]|nr:hypothetical protein [Gammaproteobacteria bacterium]
MELVHGFGGFASMRALEDGTDRPYELNVSLFDVLRGTLAGEDALQVPRFLASQVLMLSLQGIPALYLHSLLATSNDLDGVERTGRLRSINRRRWQLEELDPVLAGERRTGQGVLRAARPAGSAGGRAGLSPMHRRTSCRSPMRWSPCAGARVRTRCWCWSTSPPAHRSWMRRHGSDCGIGGEVRDLISGEVFPEELRWCWVPAAVSG